MDKIQIRLSTILFSNFLSIPSSYARMSGYRHPSSFSFRIKRPCTHWNSWFHPFKIEPSLEISTRQSNTLRSGGLAFIFTLSHSDYTVTSHFDLLFIITMCVERQNVVAKSNISTMLKNLKPRTISFSTRGMLIPIFWQFVEGLAIIDVVRAKKQHMIVSCKWSLFTLFRSLCRKRRFIKLWFLMQWSIFDQFYWAWFTQNRHQNYVVSVETCWLPIFHDIVRLFRSTSHSSYFRLFHRRQKQDPTNMF